MRNPRSRLGLAVAGPGPGRGGLSLDWTRAATPGISIRWITKSFPGRPAGPGRSGRNLAGTAPRPPTTRPPRILREPFRSGPGTRSPESLNTVAEGVLTEKRGPGRRGNPEAVLAAGSLARILPLGLTGERRGPACRRGPHRDLRGGGVGRELTLPLALDHLSHLPALASSFDPCWHEAGPTSSNGRRSPGMKGPTQFFTVSAIPLLSPGPGEPGTASRPFPARRFRTKNRRG